MRPRVCRVFVVSGGRQWSYYDGLWHRMWRWWRDGGYHLPEG